MSALIQRLSYIGKRPINFYKSEVSITVISRGNQNKTLNFGKLPFTNTVKGSGKLGSFDVGLVDGLYCRFSDGLSPEESKLFVEIDAHKYTNFNKYQRAFLKGMHGTTNSILMKYVEGVAEVNYFLNFIYLKRYL